MVGEVVTIDVQDYHTPILEVVEAANKANVKFYQLTYGFGDKIDEAISFLTFTDLVKNLIPN